MNATKLVLDSALELRSTKRSVLFALADRWDNGNHFPQMVTDIAKDIKRSVSNTRKIMWQLAELNLVVPYTDGISNGPWKLNTKHLQAIKADRRKGAKGE